jgi:hypothetical protein
VSQTTSDLDVYVELGIKRAFAGALDWPGWCRSGRDERAALETLLAYAPRYARALHGARLGFRMPGRRVDVRVRERVRGSAGTDFGVPEVAPSVDAAPIEDRELRRLSSVLRACWRAVDAAADGAIGIELRRGPRGGGRDLDAIVEHVRGAEEGYLSRLSWKLEKGDRDVERTREAVLAALASAARHGVEPGPRGGKRWSPRYFVRRVAWHALDHAWEIEDRSA